MKTPFLRKKRKPTSQVTDEKRLFEGKERIASAAASLFLTSGYHNTSVREIAQKAGLSVGSVFNYFTSKEEILFFLFSHVQSRTEPETRHLANVRDPTRARIQGRSVDPLGHQQHVRRVPAA